MESTMASQWVVRARWHVIAAFAAYALLSIGFACVSPFLAALLLMQSLIYAAVAVVTWRRVPWSTWLAIGIATGGTAIDLAVLASDTGVVHVLDTLFQAGLLTLALRARDNALAFPSAVSDGVSPRIGWTFALTTASLPAFVLAAAFPMFDDGGCFPVQLSSPILPGSSALLAFIALFAAMSLARMRTSGLLMIVLAVPALVAAFTHTIGTAAPAPLGGISDPARIALVGHLLLLAALLPLGPSLMRRLWPRGRS